MRIGISRSKGRRVDEENPYWMSFSDIMSALLVIFILASMKLILDLTETRNKVDQQIELLAQANQVKALILLEMKKELDKKGITVEIVDNDSILRVPADQLYFESNEYHIPDDKAYAVTTIGKILYETITRDTRNQYLDTIFIEGHTDSLPMNHGMGNWGLSTYRAIEVWNHWRNDEDIGKAISSIKNSSGNLMFSVSGYAATRRFIIDDDTDEKRRHNRRIDIRFTVKQPNIKDLSSIKDSIGL
ncbi:MAG: OmpA family protein [Desulfobacterium sp.]|jgi:flagellar motor protein MotB|nr:OmpA family protein [Desulfobacterium sp.]